MVLGEEVGIRDTEARWDEDDEVVSEKHRKGSGHKILDHRYSISP